MFICLVLGLLVGWGLRSEYSRRYDKPRYKIDGLQEAYLIASRIGDDRTSIAVLNLINEETARTT